MLRTSGEECFLTYRIKHQRRLADSLGHGRRTTSPSQFGKQSSLARRESRNMGIVTTM
jgi:hypothetical protein